MTHTRLGLLGLCTLAFVLFAFGATSAHAEKESLWLILDSNGVLKTKLEATLALEAETTQIMHTKIAGVSVLFECSGTEGVSAIVKAEGKLSGKLKYTGCITKLNGAISAACEPRAEGEKPGVIVTNALHGLIELHALAGGVKDDVLRILPDVGETFAVSEYGEECAIGEKIPTIGQLTLKDCQGQFLTHVIKHLLETGPLTELWVISKTPEHLAVTLGSVWAYLTGAHKGLQFSGDPA